MIDVDDDRYLESAQDLAIWMERSEMGDEREKSRNREFKNRKGREGEIKESHEGEGEGTE
jgi:hypothetical protein